VPKRAAGRPASAARCSIKLVVVVMEKIQTQELLEPRIKVLLVVVQFLQTELLLVVVVLAQWARMLSQTLKVVMAVRV
jgi:hypothetical protein